MENVKYRMLILISSQRIHKKAEELFKEVKAPILNFSVATGTASSEIMDLLGLGTPEKTVVITTLPKNFADDLLYKMLHTLYLGSPDSGIAFTVPLTSASAGLLHLMEAMEINNEKENEDMKNEYSMILALVNQGFSEEVMTAAHKAGATGGTVFHSRHVSSEEAKHLYGITIQEEREIVLILATKKKKTDIMNAISEKCGMQTDAHGIVFAVPVENVAGVFNNEK